MRAPSHMSKKEGYGSWIAATAVAIVLAVAAVSLLPVQEWVDSIEDWFTGMGVAGKLLFVLVYIVATLLPVPAWMFTVAAGAVFGIAWGFALVWIGAMAGATIAFLLSRHFFRDAVTRMVARKPVLGAVDKVLRKEGWQVVALLRLSPLIPFGLKNYLFGVSKVRLRDYVLGTGLGKIPAELVYVSLGATGRAVLGQDGASQWALIAVGIVATVVATHLIAAAARKRLGIAG